MPWVRILLLFEAFATVFQSQISRWCRRDSRRAYLAIVELFLAMSEGLEAIFFLSFSFFLVGSVGDVSTVLLACVLHALGTNPAAMFEAFATVFQSQISRWCRRDSRRAYLAIVELFLAMSEGLEAILFLSFSFFLVGSVGDVSTVLLACVLHALGTNPAAVRGFRNRFPKPNFEMMSARFQTSVPGYSRIVSCDVGRPGGYLISFLFFLFSGFRRRRFESFIGLCFLHALGTNPAAVRGFRNRFPKPNFEMMSARFQTSVPSFSFFLVGSVGDVSRVLLACVLHALGTNPAAVRGFRNRFPKPNFEMMSARFQTSVPGYSRIVSCDVGRPGGYLFSFLFFLFSGFRRRRFDSFIGLCFACLGYESCCCSRLSQPFSKAKFRDDVGAIPDERTWLPSRSD